MEEDIEKISELTFHETDYLVRLSANKTELSLTLEDRDSGEIWSSIFAAEYIEEITQKTGNQKKYRIFVKMLLSAIMRSSESVSIDILTPQAMENLKMKKQYNNNRQTLQQNNNGNINTKKRYVVLTYLVEYDKVSYPLPLKLIENPDTNTLKQIITRLRLENQVLRQNNPETKDQQMILQLKQENELLRAKLRKPNEDYKNQQDNQLKAQSESIEEIRYLTQMLEVKQRELAVLKSENAQLLEHAQSFEEMRDAVGKIKEGERVMFSQQQRMEQMDLEMSSILEELETYKKNDKKQKQRISVLEAELESILARRSSTQRTARPRSSSAKNGHSNNQSGIGLASPLRNSLHSHTNSLHLLNSSGRQTPTNLSRNNSMTNLKRTPSKGSQMQHPNSSSLKRRNSIDSDTASSKARKTSNNSNNLRTYSPIRSSGGQSLSTKRTGNTPQKKTVLSSTGRIHSRSPTAKAQDISGKSSSTSFPSSSQQNHGNFQKNSNNNSKKYLEKKADMKKTTSNNNNSKQMTNNSESSDDESRLVRKLEELRSKNKENQENSGISRRSRMVADNTQRDTGREDVYKNKQAFLEHSAASSSQCDNTFEITDKLTGLQELLRAAKNTKS